MNKTEVDVGEIVTEVAALLRAGASAKQAWAQTLNQRQVHPAWARAGEEIASGVPIDEALTSLAAQIANPGPLLGAAAGSRLARNLGSSAAEVLDAAAVTVTEVQNAAAERHAALAGPRATMRLLLALPPISLLLFQVAGMSTFETLLSTPAGGVCLALGAVLLILGNRWVRRLILQAQRDEKYS